jgi:hypothetical protein
VQQQHQADHDGDEGGQRTAALGQRRSGRQHRPPARLGEDEEMWEIGEHEYQALNTQEEGRVGFTAAGGHLMGGTMRSGRVRVRRTRPLPRSQSPTASGEGLGGVGAAGGEATVRGRTRGNESSSLSHGTGSAAASADGGIERGEGKRRTTQRVRLSQPLHTPAAAGRGLTGPFASGPLIDQPAEVPVAPAAAGSCAAHGYPVAAAPGSAQGLLIAAGGMRLRLKNVGAVNGVGGNGTGAGVGGPAAAAAGAAAGHQAASSSYLGGGSNSDPNAPHGPSGLAAVRRNISPDAAAALVAAAAAAASSAGPVAGAAAAAAGGGVTSRRLESLGGGLRIASVSSYGGANAAAVESGGSASAGRGGGGGNGFSLLSSMRQKVRVVNLPRSGAAVGMQGGGLLGSSTRGSMGEGGMGAAIGMPEAGSDLPSESLPPLAAIGGGRAEGREFEGSERRTSCKSPNPTRSQQHQQQQQAGSYALRSSSRSPSPRSQQEVMGKVDAGRATPGSAGTGTRAKSRSLEAAAIVAGHAAEVQDHGAGAVAAAPGRQRPQRLKIKLRKHE